MRLFAVLLPRKGAVYGGAAILLGLMPQPFNSTFHAAEPRAIQLPDQTPRDWMLTNTAKRALLALQKDEQFGPLNLGVSVNNKVATIWGTLPSAEMSTRAEETLKKITGIAAVMNECRIVPADPVPQAIADAVRKSRHVSSDTSAPAPPPAAMTSRMVAKPGPDGIAPKPSGELNEVTTAAPTLSPPAATLLLPPIVNNVPVAAANDWEKVRLSEKRFKDVKLQVGSGVVKIDGVVPRMKDAWDLAKKLNALPGVKQVILGNVSEK